MSHQGKILIASSAAAGLPRPSFTALLHPTLPVCTPGCELHFPRVLCCCLSPQRQLHCSSGGKDPRKGRGSLQVDRDGLESGEWLFPVVSSSTARGMLACRGRCRGGRLVWGHSPALTHGLLPASPRPCAVCGGAAASGAVPGEAVPARPDTAAALHGAPDGQVSCGHCPPLPTPLLRDAAVCCQGHPWACGSLSFSRGVKVRVITQIFKGF